MVCHVVIMGVAGVGKTTVGRGVADSFGLPFADADDFHSQANRAKMGAGCPLTDEDRWPWLRSLRDWMAAEGAEGRSAVVACSALRRAYRDVLREAGGEAFFVHLVLPEVVNVRRLSSREGHYMKPSMLKSQLAVLEPLAEPEGGVEILNVGSPQDVIAEVVRVLRAQIPSLVG